MKLPQTNFRSLQWVGRASTRAVKTRLAAYGVCRAVGQAAFTMVEVALALAVIAFALVAIIGILPSGMTVQKENREETIINQDAMVLLEAIRSGAKGFDDLVNYIDRITVTRLSSDDPVSTTYTINDWKDAPGMIVGLLTTPKYCPSDRPVVTNIVEAEVRALSGSAVEKYPQANRTIREGAFGYKLISEVVACLPPPGTNGIAGAPWSNLYELRLTFLWPLRPNGDTGLGRQTFRTRVGGQLVSNSMALFYFNPGTYAATSQL